MAHIVVLGAGLGGVIMAYEMREKLGRNDRVTIINKGTTFSFVPSNPWIAVGWRKKSDIEVDLVPVLARHGIAFKSAGAKKVHPSDNRIELLDGTYVDYDYLVIATGPELAFDEVQGLGPTAHTHSICHVDHALKAYDGFKQLAAKPGPVVVGAAQSASCFGPAYEFAFVLDKALRDAKVRDRVPMTFVTPEPYIGHLGLDGVGDTKGLLESQLREHHIKWITSAKTRTVEPDRMIVDEIADDGTVRQTHEVPFVYAMMLPAFRGIDAVSGIEGLVNPRGFILIDKHQQNPKFKNIFGIGVCVAIPPIGKTAVPVGVPKTGFMIESMVTATAHNIGQLVAGQQPTAQGTWNAVCLADFGDGGIAFVAQPQIRPATSIGHLPVDGSTSRKWALRSIFFAKSARENLSRSTKRWRCKCWASTN